MNALKRDRHTRGSNVIDETALPERKAVARATVPREAAGVLTGTIQLPANVKSLSFDYRSATPFPHLILDNLFSEELLDRVIQELPPLGDAHWVRHDDNHLQQFNLRSAADLGEAGSQVVAFLHSARFLYFLSEVTGIRDLLPDPYLQGAGYHMIPRGGKFDVHLDRNVAYSTGLVRRLSLLIYLNRDWKHEYGGQLELWSKDGKRPEVVIEPIFNRTTIFEITDENYHGVPAVVRCPKGRSRNCFVVYYHTAQVREEKDLTAHTSIYGPRSYAQSESKFRQFVKDLVPPILLRGFRKLNSE